MRILQLAPLWEAVPPPAYGGTEAVVHLLTEGLVAAGHEVILAASGDSTTSASHLVTYERSLRRATDLTDRNPYDWAHIAAALDAAGDCDVVHNHAGELPMAMSRLIGTPMLTTMHCLTTPDTRFIWQRYGGAYNTISRSQFRQVPTDAGGTYMGHVYNSIDVASFPFQREKSDDLLFLSRVAPEKGPQIAIEVAKRTGRRLLIAGKVDQYDQRFFDEVVRDLIDGEQIVFLGEADAVRKRELYASARCVLMPLMWEEPFGLVMPESMACGTPVIALRRGSAPELIQHGVTGFVCDSVEEMTDAVGRVDEIDPAVCRAHVEARFAPRRMTDAYVSVYERMLESAPKAEVPSALSKRTSEGDTEAALAVA